MVVTIINPSLQVLATDLVLVADRYGWDFELNISFDALKTYSSNQNCMFFSKILERNKVSNRNSPTTVFLLTEIDVSTWYLK